MGRPLLLTKKMIVNYWKARAHDHTFNIDVSDLGDEICWRCTDDLSKRTRKLHRCHIVPLSLGGSNEADNYALLCARCHDEMPDTSNRDYFFSWLKEDEDCTALYGTFRQHQGIKKAFNKIDIKELELLVNDYGMKNTSNLIRDIIKNNVSNHLSGNYGNIRKQSNYEFIVYELFNKIKNRAGKKKGKTHPI